MFSSLFNTMSSISAPATKFIKAGWGSTPPARDIDNPFAELLSQQIPLEEPNEDCVFYAQLIKDIWDDEDAKRLPVRQKSMVAWELYHNIYTQDLEKDEWQSKKKFPLVGMTVERIVAAIARLRESNPQWYRVESVIPDTQIYMNLARELMNHWLNHDSVQFSSKFKQCIKSGLLNTQMAMQVVFEVNQEVPSQNSTNKMDDAPDPFKEYANWSAYSEAPGATDDAPFVPNPNMPRLRLELIDPMDLLIDSSGSGEWKMWRTYCTAGQLMEYVETRGYNYDACRRAVLNGPSEREMKRTEHNMRKGQNSGRYHANEGKIVCTHFEGTMTDPSNGTRLFRNKYMVMANAEIVLEPQDIKNWDQEHSIVAANFQNIPHSTTGKSLITDSLDAFHSRHDMTNLLLDFFQLTLMGIHELDTDLLDKSEDPPTKLFPGMLLRTKKKGPKDQAVTPVMMADLPQGFWQFMQFFQQQFSEYTGMTQELMGMPRTRGRITGMEHQARTSESGSLMSHFFSDIEDTFLSNVLRLAFLRILQYTPDKMWRQWVLSNKKAILPKGPTDPQIMMKWSKALDECANWDAKTRFKYLGGYFKFRVQIFNSQMERQAEIEQLIYLLQNLAKVPSALNVLRIDKFINELVIRFGMDPEKLLKLEAVPTPPDQAEMNMDPTVQPNINIENYPVDLMGGATSMFNQAMQGIDGTGMFNQQPEGPPFPGGPADVGPGMPKPPGGY